MSALRRFKRPNGSGPGWPLKRPNGGGPGAQLQPGGPAPGERPSAIPTGELDRRRADAARRFAEAHWDLGGIAYEMAVRDHFRLDVLQRQAARVQELDAELSQLERLMLLEESGAAGTCPECATPFGRGAAFCSSCGSGLVDTVVAP